VELTLDRIFLDCSVRCLNELASRVDDCLCRLDGSQVWFRGGESQNAVGNLVLHLAGNVRQWVVSGVSGAPDVRDRDAEFAARSGAGVGELRQLLGATVRKAATVVASVPPARLASKPSTMSSSTSPSTRARSSSPPRRPPAKTSATTHT